MKLWQKSESNPSSPLGERVEAFTVGRDRELDLDLAPFDLLGSIAHVQMLAEVGLLTDEERIALRGGLRAIYREIEAGSFVIEAGIEDVHSQVEHLLTQRLGEVGKKIHAGRSRNDQVLVDLKLFFLARIEGLVGRVEALFDRLIGLSRAHAGVLMPGYTHTQVAMPSSFGLWFGAYAESLIDDLRGLHYAWRVADQNPLGSAAGYGSSFPLDRRRTTELLGFGELAYNVVYAQMGRGKTERVLAQAMAEVAATLNKFSADVIVFVSQNFGFLSFPDALTTGSSIMPHKKNPDPFELLRARTNHLQSLPFNLAMITTNQISGYHRDLQLLKELLLPALDSLDDCLEMAETALAHVRVNEDLLDDARYRYLFSVEAVNKLVLESDYSFREAYREVGKQIERGDFSPEKKVHHTHLGSVGAPAQDEIEAKFQGVRRQFLFEKKRDAWHRLLAE